MCASHNNCSNLKLLLKKQTEKQVFIPSDYLITLPATRCPRKSNLPRQTTKGCRPCVDVFYEIVARRYLKIMRRAVSAQSILLRCLPRWYQYHPVARTAGDLPSNNEGSASWSRRIGGKKGKKEKQFSPHITPPSLYPLRTCTSKQWWGSGVVVVVLDEAKPKACLAM